MSLPPPWPAEAYALMHSADRREQATGCLLFAQWEQQRAGRDLLRTEPGSHWWLLAAEKQRAAARNMWMARAALEACDE